MKDSPLNQNKQAQATLNQKLSSLTLLPNKPVNPSSSVNNFSGKTFKLQDNALNAQAVSFTFIKNTCRFKLQDDKGENEIVCGLQDWVKGETRMPGNPPKFVQLKHPDDEAKVKVAAFGSWRDPNTFVMTWAFFETPHSDTITCHFQNDSVRLEFKNSIAVKAPSRAVARPVLEGHLAG
jgi:hypothetical protein